MSEERLFRVDEGGAKPVPSTNLSQMGFKETKDLERWVIEHPRILGDGIMIISDQFGRWEAATGERPLDRLDVLGLDSDGRLVLAELKRDRAPRDVHLQAITYAALVARFSPDHVVQELRRHMQRQAEEEFSRSPDVPLQDVTLDAAQALIEEHCEGPLDDDLLRSPRIVLVAGGFNPVTITAVDWLTAQGLDITLQKVQAYRLPSGEKIVTVSKLYPVASMDDFLVTPVGTRVEKKREQREKNTVFRIVEEGLLEDGTKLTFNIVTGNQEHRELIESWLKENPEAATATWQNSTTQPLIWDYDSQGYKPTTIAKRIFSEATGETPSALAGPQWWLTPGEQTLSQLAGYGGGAGFDWTPLHTLLKTIPAGRWTSYGELAAKVGTAAQPLGQHIATCEDCHNAWRILDAQGRSTPQFKWADLARKDTQQEALQSEGISFTGDGRADMEARITAEELEGLTKNRSLSDP